MRILIIEDEKLTADDLADNIIQLVPNVQIVRIIDSVQSGLTFFKEEHAIDLIFSDIQLGDGLSFDIFREVSVSAPIIFCTAYDEYALNAFNVNGIDYVLKPFTNAAIQKALAKYWALKDSFYSLPQKYEELLKAFDTKEAPKSSAILVHQKGKIIPVKVEQIAVFYIKHDTTHILTFGNEHFLLNKKLDELEQMCGNLFFRANRQFLINRNAVKDVSHHLSRKLEVALSVNIGESVLVSKEKMTVFLNWLAD